MPEKLANLSKKEIVSESAEVHDFLHTSKICECKKQQICFVVNWKGKMV